MLTDIRQCFLSVAHHLGLLHKSTVKLYEKLVEKLYVVKYWYSIHKCYITTCMIKVTVKHAYIMKVTHNFLMLLNSKMLRYLVLNAGREDSTSSMYLIITEWTFKLKVLPVECKEWPLDLVHYIGDPWSLNCMGNCARKEMHENAYRHIWKEIYFAFVPHMIQQ